ncbi:MAG: hypothetical protein Q9169_008392, partial [Polycauliona sp. 2 TL-2023]
PDEQGLVTRIETSINSCDDLIRELEKEYKKFDEETSAVRAISRRVAYPFRRSTLEKLDEDISEIRENLRFALDVLQLNHSQKVEDGIADIKALLELVSACQISSDLAKWLNAPDATVNHNTACAKKHPGTGLWLTQSPEFLHWLTEPNSILWLNGFAGSGKSVLCSTAIQAALRQRGSDRGIGIAFFYFTFNDDSKQDVSSMLRSLLLQLSNQLEDGHADLKRLQESHKTSIPPVPTLLAYFQRIMQRFRQVYILLDALDESPRTGLRVHVLDALETLQSYGMQQLHLFVTSRDELDIRDALDLPTAQQVKMQNAGIDQDITNYVTGQLSGDRRLRRLSNYHDKIQQALTSGAKGVFRWVECQLRSLYSCPRSEDILNKVLGSLPESLDETYERMLCNIDGYLAEDARRILTLLCFASRPLEVEELIDGVAVEIVGSKGLNRKRRLQDADDIRDICQGLIDVSLGNANQGETEEDQLDEDLIPIIRIAHFSVQEYLESERIRRSEKAMFFSLISAAAHSEIAQICIVYLLDDSLASSSSKQEVVEEFPMAHYAAQFWYHHYEKSVNADSGLNTLVLALFNRRQCFETWVCLYNMDDYAEKNFDFNRRLDGIPSPIYYASLLGLDWTVKALIDKGADINAVEEGGYYCTALQVASRRGHETVAQLLLEEGTNIHAQHTQSVEIYPKRWYGSTLHAACKAGRTKIVRMLLDKGAIADDTCEELSVALFEASGAGHTKIVRMLLDEGASVNDMYWGCFALQFASGSGHLETVRVLLEAGANVNNWNAMLEFPRKEANVNAAGEGGSAGLVAASGAGQVEIVRTLLDNGAHVNDARDGGSTALVEASGGSHTEI